MLTPNLNKFSQLSQNERWLVCQSVLLLPVIHFCLYLLGYSCLLGVMEKLAPLKSNERMVTGHQILQRGQAISRVVSIAATHGFYKASCLRRSLLVWWFLRKEGIESRIFFGVRLFDQKMEAHAWVEYNKMVLNDSANVHENYQVLQQDVLPPTRQGL